MMKTESPRSFSYAKRYYELGDHSEKIRRLIEQANKLGDASAKKGNYGEAVEYYGFSDTNENEAKIKQMNAYLEEESKKKEEQLKKDMQELIKDEKKQKEFKKGQDNLEKELGF